MDDQIKQPKIEFAINRKDLYREESISDLKVATIRKLVPVKPNGGRDNSRCEKFVGHTQVMSPDGPLPLQAALPANNLKEALDVFPQAMNNAMAAMIERIKALQKSQKKEEGSRIIVPGQ